LNASNASGMSDISHSGGGTLYLKTPSIRLFTDISREFSRENEN
jgi:hypothetical protein